MTRMLPHRTGSGMKNNRNDQAVFSAFAAMAFLVSAAFILPACVPSYPKEELPEAVKNICHLEYGMDVDVMVTDSTMALYYPMEGLLDVGLGISTEAWDKISNLILVASRVTLSTDADVKFYCVITQDVRLPELQVVIIKYVEDVKRGMYRNISRSESYKRTLFSINLTPQARKERTVEKVFERLNIEEDTQEKILDEFFRSPPTKLSDIGYWRGRFYIKDISLGEFLGAQIANRIKIDFKQDEHLAEYFSYKSAESEFIESPAANSFLLKFKIADQREPDAATNPRVVKVQELVRIANEVVTGYKFRDFAFMRMIDQLENVVMTVSEKDIYDFNKKRLPVEEIVQTPAGYF